MFYLVVLSPCLTDEQARLLVAVNRRFRTWVRGCAWVLAMSGAYMTVDRLTSTRLGVPYVLTLAVKVALALGMFFVAWRLSDRTRLRSVGGVSRLDADGRVASVRRRLFSPPLLLLCAGIVVFILGAVLNVMSQAALLTLHEYGIG